MNEQIEKLAEQAGLKVESWMTNPPKPFQILGSTEDFEKFAELIVKECMDIISVENAKVDGEWRCKDGKHIWYKIADTFGVE